MTDNEVLIQDAINPSTKKRKQRRSQEGRVPYASATAGVRAREETLKILKRLGASEGGFKDHYETGEVLLYFVHRHKQFQIRIPAKGLAVKFLQDRPYSYRMRSAGTEAEEFLKEVLAAGPIPQKEVKGPADGHGLSRATVRRASKRLGVNAQRESTGTSGTGRWVWFLAAGCSSDPQDVHPFRVSTLQGNEHLAGTDGALRHDNPSFLRRSVA